MARELQQTAPDDRRRRVQRLKKMIIGIVIVGLLIPILCCVYLICRLHAINGTLRDLEQRLGELDARDRERQTLLQQLQSETAIQQGVQTQEEVTSGEVSEHTPESDPGQEMIHKVYLTFDDGPSIYTDEILDILDRYHVKATFFVVGKDGSEAEEALQRIVEDGHTLGMHSYSHKYKELYESLDSFAEDFARIRDDIYLRPVWKASIIVFLGAAPIWSAILICMNLLIIWTVRAWNILTGMCPPEMAEAGICLSIPCWRIVQRISIPEIHRSYCCMTLRRNRLRWKHYRIS